jgi:uroporphyrin-III C-methyltransferase
LKGGDPFVFGRGGEELEFAARHGLLTAVVPGISSAVAVAAALNIPVTSRGYSESFWVVTGTTMSGEISNDIALAAKSTATVVILMGLNKLKEIMQVFQANGKSETPVAVIQNGTLADQKHVIGNAETIEELVHKNRIGSPAIIVVGEVVRYADVIGKLSTKAVRVTHYQ